MIEVLSGHLASGRWRVKQVDGIPVLSHLQPFSRRAEYRIGPDQVTSLTIHSQNTKTTQLSLHFQNKTYCTANVPNSDLPLLQDMVSRNEIAPVAINSQRPWIIGMCLFFSIWIVIELLRPLFS
jgi:hypothetical protein